MFWGALFIRGYVCAVLIKILPWWHQFRRPYILDMLVWTWCLSRWVVEGVAKVFCRWIVTRSPSGKFYWICWPHQCLWWSSQQQVSSWTLISCQICVFRSTSILSIPKWKIFWNSLIAPMSLMIVSAAGIGLSIATTPDIGIPLSINFVNCSQWILWDIEDWRSLVMSRNSLARAYALT